MQGFLVFKRFFYFMVNFMLAISFLNAQQTDKLPFKEYNDISYVTGLEIENDSLQRLNLIVPQNAENAPLFIWIGGGAWSYGDRHQEMQFARKLVRKGIAVASIGHQMSPAIWKDSTLNKGVQHPVHIRDVAKATKWLYDHAGDYKLKVDNFFIGGYSSGAHLAALLELDKRYLIETGLPESLFKGIIPISGAFDIINYHEVLKNSNRPELAELHVEAVFGTGEENFKLASPVNYLENLKTPILLISDTNMYNYSRLFEEKIRNKGFTKLESVYVHHLSHGALWKDLSFSEHSLYREIIINFIRKNL